MGLKRPARGAQLAFDECQRHRVEAGAADVLGHVGGVETLLEGARADLRGELGRHLARAVDLLLIGVELLLDEGAQRVDEEVLLGAQAKSMACSPMASGR